MATRIMFGMDSDGARWSGGASCGEITCGPSFLYLPVQGKLVEIAFPSAAEGERDTCKRNAERLFKGNQNWKLENSV